MYVFKSIDSIIYGRVEHSFSTTFKNEDVQYSGIYASDLVERLKNVWFKI